MHLQSSQQLNALRFTPYRYRHLDPNEIRVLDLLPGTDQDRITVKIRHTLIEDLLDTECTALSYTWGDPKNTQVIQCSKEGHLLVTNECFSALHRLRLPDKPKTLWIDAICINQSDIPERNLQVTLMSRIYHLSSEVAIYLGDESADSKLALKYITDHYYQRFKYGLANMGVRTMEAIQRLFSRPWFSRVWVIQEARNAKVAQVYCGDEIFSWECILTLPWNAPYFPESSLGRQPYVAVPPSTYWKREKYAYIGDELSPELLYQHLLRSKGCSATDPRDKVFALLPLFKNADDALVEADLLPDYAFETEKVFLNVARYLIRSVGWALLYAVEGGSVLNLPSWCPDWSILPATPLLYDLDRIPFEDDFPPPSTNSPTILSNNTLLIHAIRHSAITHISVPCDISSPTWPTTIFQDWYDFLLDTFALHHTERTPYPADPDKSPGQDTEYYLLSIYSFLNAHGNDYGISRHRSERIDAINAYANAPNGEHNQGQKQAQDRFRHRCQGQRVFLTGKGNIGLAPVNAEVGDILVCVEAGTVPFLLREEVDGKARLVGKCEVIRIMPKEDAKSHMFDKGPSRGREFVKEVLGGGEVFEEFLIV
ncbi:hypothetical protein S7711_06096 [Stachybotrys chartarum IBT 7711]|uniref:Heterokaryon incompatibility domain-containing protein n=1 Tax=Stachybotrys chartarum (strain CBS 109288 / IBT 7711) TaxID=1280523 RepID=A0A084B8K8_STACB|nr:hypothetical protein S7711_06096 [Stachybotrys chartarum IBT 7711]